MGKRFCLIGDLAGGPADDGKRFDALGVVFGAGGFFRIRRGGSLREGRGKRFAGELGWRMTGSALTRWTFYFVDGVFWEGRESEGGEWVNKFYLAGGWRMTGSALTRWTLEVRAGGFDRGGSSREGSGRPILPDRRLADDGKRSPALDVGL